MKILFALLAAGCVVGASQAGDDQKNDLKIESQWSTAWDVGSVTTYVKGDFLRHDDCSGDRAPCVDAEEGSVSQCGVWTVWRFDGRFYELNADGSLPAEFTAP